MEAVNRKDGQSTTDAFDFVERREDTATLDDLLAQIGAERAKANGELITRKTLGRVITFLERAIGLRVGRRGDPLPMPALKTIKLLFEADADSKRNLLALLEPPEFDDEATMEFSTMTTLPRDAAASAAISSLIDSLSREIDPDRLRMFSALLGKLQDHSVAERLILHAERTGDEIYQTLREALSGDEAVLSGAYLSVATLLENFEVVRSDEHQVCANEALYVYLQTLAFRHYALHYPLHMQRTRISGEIASIEQEANLLCELAASGAPHHGAAARKLSVSTVHNLVQAWPKEIAALVERTTGFATSVKQVRGNQDRAKVLLASYAYRSFDCTDLGAPVLSVYDIVAALSSFRYQQEAGDDYQPYWHGQVEQGKSPQRHFDKGLDPLDPHQHQGVLHIYLNRFYEYQASLNGTAASHRAWMRYQTAMLSAYQSVLKLNDIMAIVMALTSLNFLCVSYAKDYVIEHLRSTR